MAPPVVDVGDGGEAVPFGPPVMDPDSSALAASSAMACNWYWDMLCLPNERLRGPGTDPAVEPLPLPPIACPLILDALVELVILVPDEVDSLRP